MASSEFLGPTLAVDPGDRRVALATDGGVHVLDAQTGILATPLDTGRANSVEWHPDGRQLVLGFDKGEVQLVDVMTGARLRTFAGLNAFVTAVAVDPRGERVIATESIFDGSLPFTLLGSTIVWDIDSGAALTTMGPGDTDPDETGAMIVAARARADAAGSGSRS